MRFREPIAESPELYESIKPRYVISRTRAGANIIREAKTRECCGSFGRRRKDTGKTKATLLDEARVEGEGIAKWVDDSRWS